MAAQSLFSAAIVGAIASVSAAGLAVGTHIRNIEAAAGKAGDLHTAGGAPIRTGALADSTVLPASTPAERDTSPPAIAPSFSRIVIEQAGISRLEGFGMPGGEVVIRSSGQQIAVAKPGRDGSWTVRLDHALPPGEHRLGSTTDTPSRVLIGEDVRVFVPADFEGDKVIAYEAPQADIVRRRAETLAVIAAQDFDEALAKKSAEEKAREKDKKPVTTADNSAAAGTKAAPSSDDTSVTAPVVDWLDRSHRMFNDLVAKPLSVPPAGGGAEPPAAKQVQNEAAAESNDGDKAAHGAEAEASLLDRVRNWFAGAGAAFDSAVVEPLKQDGDTEAKSETKKAEAADAAAEKAAADKRRADEAARRVAEEQKRKDAALKEAEAKSAAEANSAEALKKAEEARRRQAAETEKMQADVKRAAEAAAKRTAETEKRLEESLKRLDDAEKKQREAQDLKKAEAAQRELEAARKDYQDRRAAAEANSGKKLAATAQPAPRNEPPPAAAKEAPAAAKIAPVDAAEDERQEEEEYKILRRMLAEAKRLTFGETPRNEETTVAESSGVSEVAEERVDGSRVRRSVDSTATSFKKRSKTVSRTCAGHRKGRRPGYHFVGTRDTLWGIARRHYGDGARYDIIYRANRDRIKNPDVLRPCQWIRIPGKRRYH